VDGGMSRNAAAKRLGVNIASAVRWVVRFKATGRISAGSIGEDRCSHKTFTLLINQILVQSEEKGAT
jgi:transposase